MKAKDVTALRKRLDLSRGDLAEALDVDPATVWRWEKGKLPVSKRTAAALELLEFRSGERLRT